MRRVEVTHIAPSAFGPAGMWGGGERYPLCLAQAMSEHVPTRLIVFGTEASRRTVGKLEICQLPTRKRWHGDPVNPLSERLPLFVPLTQRFHVHQYHSVVTNLVLLAGKAARRDVFVTDHGGAAHNYADRMGLERLVAGFLPVSAFSARFFPQLAGKTSEPLLGGADTTRFHPDGGERKRQLVYIGRLLPHKGIDVLLRAVDSTTPVRIYGRAYDAGYLEHLRGLAEGKDVVFHESAADEEIAVAYRSARISVLPSVHRTYDGVDHPYPELLGLTVIEAMASGTPVIASRVGGIPEIVQDGVTGYLVDPGDVATLRLRIDALLEDSPRWESMSKAALESVRSTLTWELTAQRALRAYERFGR